MANEFYQLDLVIGTSGVERTEQQLRAVERLMEQTQRRAAALGRTRMNPTVQLNDRLTSSASRITSSMNRLDRMNAKPEVRLLDRASAGIGKLSSMLGNLTRKAFRVTVNTAVTGAAILTGAAVYTGVKSTQKAMNFQNQMKSIQALTQISDEDLGKMQALALSEGMRTKYNALEAAQGEEALLKAGLSVSQVQDGGLGAALNLATAGGMQMVEAAELMSTSLNAYKKDALSAARTSDILAGTANASAVDLNDLRYSLSMVGAVADGVGASFLDTNLALGVLGNNGLKGSDAGTSLKTLLLNLVPETAKAYGLFEDFGLLTMDATKSIQFMQKNGIKPASSSFDEISKAMEKFVAKQEGIKTGTARAAKATRQFLMSQGLIHSAFYDDQGNIKDMTSIADTLQKSLKGLTNEQRQFYLKQMFGTDAIRAANILYKEGAKGIKDFQREMSNVTALKVAKDKMNSATGAVEMFKGAVETLQISALLPTMPIIQKVVTKLSEVVTRYTPELTAAMEKMTSQAESYVKTHFLNNTEFQNLSLKGKIGFVFDDLQAQFDTWWGSTGQGVVANMAGKIGAGLGGALKGVFMGALGLLDDGDDSPYKTAGESAGAAFFTGFIESFDAGVIAKKAASAIGNVYGNAITEPSTGTLGLAGGITVAAAALGKPIYTKVLKPTIDIAKSVLGTGKNVVQTLAGKAPAVVAGSEGAIIAGESAARGAAAGVADASQSKIPWNELRRDPRYRPGGKLVNPPKDFAVPGLKVASKVALPLVAAVDAYSIATADPGRDRAEKVGSSLGGWSGAWAGATAGGAVGSVIPGPGTAIGAIVGGIGGGLGGSWVGGGLSDLYMDKMYGKKKQTAPVIDAVLGSKLPVGVDAVLGRNPDPYTGRMNNTKNSTETQTVRISPEQISSMENGIRNIKAETTNQFNITLPPGTVQVTVQNEEIDYDVIGQRVGGTIAAEMRRRTQNFKP
ncbi:phage tail tape measure protein [Paenibacillus sp. FSL H7-0714]|uniref:phage tail tape measure protein n=1 Tax=Paenibacillus sp. FSL H7-0714 TaxID=2954735 RepID=UPI0030FCBCC7